MNFFVTDATQAASSSRVTGGCCTYIIFSAGAPLLLAAFFLLVAERPLDRARAVCGRGAVLAGARVGGGSPTR